MAESIPCEHSKYKYLHEYSLSHLALFVCTVNISMLNKYFSSMTICVVYG